MWILVQKPWENCEWNFIKSKNKYPEYLAIRTIGAYDLGSRNDTIGN